MRALFESFKHGLEKTKTTLVRRLQAVFAGVKEWDESVYERLEAALIAADLGVDVSTHVVASVRDQYARGLIHDADGVLEVARQELLRLLTAKEMRPLQFSATGPTVVLLIGVNGSGKTTTTAKLAHLWKTDGKNVLLAACDTYRAAGIEQLCLWADRVGCPVVAGKQGGDAAAVAFDAVGSAVSRKVDVLLIDTAGRQHTRKGLMEELAKVRRTLAKACPGAPHEVLLTIDASSGGNALVQAREFGRLCDVTGVILTKLDGTGKGGVVVAIRQELGYPVYFVGLGEKLDDLQPFDPQLFSQALFEREPR